MTLLVTAWLHGHTCLVITRSHHQLRRDLYLVIYLFTLKIFVLAWALILDCDNGIDMLQANEEQQSSGGGGLSLTLDDLESGSAQADHTPSDGRIILDDIDWDLVSEQHGTRSAAQCLTKWYTQLAPSMVTKGEQTRCRWS